MSPRVIAVTLVAFGVPCAFVLPGTDRLLITLATCRVWTASIVILAITIVAAYLTMVAQAALYLAAVPALQFLSYAAMRAVFRREWNEEPTSRVGLYVDSSRHRHHHVFSAVFLLVSTIIAVIALVFGLR